MSFGPAAAIPVPPGGAGAGLITQVVPSQCSRPVAPAAHTSGDPLAARSLIAPTFGAATIVQALPSQCSSVPESLPAQASAALMPTTACSLPTAGACVSSHPLPVR